MTDYIQAAHEHGGKRAAARALSMPWSTFCDGYRRQVEAMDREEEFADALFDDCRNDRVLVIPDIHAPYHHQDALAFLSAVKEAVRPDRVVCLGDELDNHAISFHDSDPDLRSAGDELEQGRAFLHQLEQMFPRMDLVDSNHGSLAYRRAKAHGLPKHLILAYGDVIFGERRQDGSIFRPNGRGEGWKWHMDLTINLCGRADLPCVFVHSYGMNTKRNAEAMGCNLVQGHHHSTFDIQYSQTPRGLFFGMTAGCLIDRESAAFAYGRYSPKKPVLGCGAIIGGVPRLFPMIVDSTGRWIGKVV